MIAVAALLFACAVFVLIPGSPEPRLQRLVPVGKPRQRSLTPQQRQWGAAAVVAIGCVSVFGIFPGFPMAIGGVLLVLSLMGRLESTDSRRHRLALQRQLPDALDVMTSILEAGAPPASALSVVGQALGPPIGVELERVARALALGASTEQAWSPSHSVMRPLATAMSRSAKSGAPLALVLTGASADARREHRVRVEIAARSAGVRAVAPLAACFLPAFFLMGVAPIVASFVQQMLQA